MTPPRGTWPVPNGAAFQTTCSQCHTHIATPTERGPVICPRCKAMIEASDGQPFGTPRFYPPQTSGQSLAEIMREADATITTEEAADHGDGRVP